MLDPQFVLYAIIISLHAITSAARMVVYLFPAKTEFMYHQCETALYFFLATFGPLADLFFFFYSSYYTKNIGCIIF